MKSSVQSALSWAIIPGLLVAHYLTQHAAFLFLVGLVAATGLLVVVIAGVLWGLWVIGTDLGNDSKFDESMQVLCRDMAKLNTGWRVPAGWVVFVLILSYLLYVNAFVAATLYLLGTLAAKGLLWVFTQTDELRNSVQP